MISGIFDYLQLMWDETNPVIKTASVLKTQYVPLTDETIKNAVDKYCSEDPREKEEAIQNHGPIENWNTSKVTNMTKLFYYKETFNADISGWNVSNVTNMAGMFMYAGRFNKDLSSWNVGKVTDMSDMFNCAGSFNQDLNTWDVSNCNTMYGMFSCAYKFNGNIRDWKIKTGADLRNMFNGATDFNQNLSSWNVYDSKTECMFAYSKHLDFGIVRKWGNFYSLISLFG